MQSIKRSITQGSRFCMWDSVGSLGCVLSMSGYFYHNESDRDHSIYIFLVLLFWFFLKLGVVWIDTNQRGIQEKVRGGRRMQQQQQHELQLQHLRPQLPSVNVMHVAALYLTGSTIHSGTCTFEYAFEVDVWKRFWDLFQEESLRLR